MSMKTSKIPPKRPENLQGLTWKKYSKLLDLAIQQREGEIPLSKKEKAQLATQLGQLAEEEAMGGGDFTTGNYKGGSIQKKAKGGMIDYRKTGMFYGGGMAKKKKY
jgi:hypothetical protein